MSKKHAVDFADLETALSDANTAMSRTGANALRINFPPNSCGVCELGTGTGTSFRMFDSGRLPSMIQRLERITAGNEPGFDLA